MVGERYVPASERCRHLVHGAALYAALQDMSESAKALATLPGDWTLWCRHWPELVEEAKAIQARAFDYCVHNH